MNHQEGKKMKLKNIRFPHTVYVLGLSDTAFDGGREDINIYWKHINGSPVFVFERGDEVGFVGGMPFMATPYPYPGEFFKEEKPAINQELLEKKRAAMAKARAAKGLKSKANG